MPPRIDKFISNNTDHSRSDVRKLIKAKRVELNGELVGSVDVRTTINKDIVMLDGVRIEPIGDVYLILNKPQGYVCANGDGQHPTVIDLLKQSANFAGKKLKLLPFKDLQIAGRLDLDTTGMVLITNDGKWNHNITSPSVDCKKIYRVSLDAPLSPTAPALFARGVQLEGEKKKTRPAFLEVISPKKVRLSLSEGKYHQVKRMFAATGNHVTQLHRESIAGLSLDSALSPGQFRYITQEELSLIEKNTRGVKHDG
ncbi:MAG: pseudouridine synthase [Agarilytica sp.]